MGCKFDEGKVKLPEPVSLEGCNFSPMPYFLLGDEISPLKHWLLRPFPGKGATEDILTARWRIFSTPIKATVKNTEKYVLACLALHNYLRQTNNAVYTPQGFVDCEISNGDIIPGAWRGEGQNDLQNGAFVPIPRVRRSRYKTDCIQMKDDLKDFFCSDAGSVSWQKEYVRRTYKH